jgi:hypothetical protein
LAAIYEDGSAQFAKLTPIDAVTLTARPVWSVP